MTDLVKIANSEEFTYMEKTAAIVDEFAAGNIGGEDADALAASVGIDPEDTLSMFNAVYGEDGGMEKTAAAEDAVDFLVKVAEDGNSTYLEKCAGIADAFAAGAIDGEQGDSIALELGLDPSDVANIYGAAYGDDMEKTAAAEEAGDILVKIAEDGSSTYLEKCAGIADAYMAGAITDVEGGDIAYELGVDTDDVDSVMMAAYGDELDKEANYGVDTAKAVGRYISEKASGAYGDVKNIKKGFSKKTAMKTKLNRKDGKIAAGANDSRQSIRSLEEALKRNSEISSGRRGAGYAAGGIAALGGAGYGATKLFGNDKKKR